MKEKRDLCSLCLLQSSVTMGKKIAGSSFNEVVDRASRLTIGGLGQSQMIDSNMDQKVMAVGGHFDP